MTSLMKIRQHHRARVLNEELTCGATEHGGVLGAEVVGFTRLIRLELSAATLQEQREDEGANQSN